MSLVSWMAVTCIAVGSMSVVKADVISDTDNGLIPGTDAVEISFSIAADRATLLILFNGDVDLWTSSPDTGLMQVFLSVDRLSVPDNRRGPEGSSDIQFAHDVPNNQFIAQSLNGRITDGSESYVEINSASYEMSFATEIFQFGGLANGELVEWGLVLTSAQSSATYDQVAQTGSFDRGREIFRSSGFTYLDGTIEPVATPPSPITEPGTLALLGAGLIGMGFARRRKKVQ